MEKYESASEQLRQIAGQIRLLAALTSPVPNRPAVDRAVLERALHRVAAELDRLARKTEPGRACPTGTREGDRP